MMNHKIVVTTLSIFSLCLLLPSLAVAEEEPSCDDVGGTAYAVMGEVNTENVSDLVQIGSIVLTLTNKDSGDVEFSEEGLLIGTITGSNMVKTFLSHHAEFSPGNMFTTRGDEAIPTPPFVRRFLEDDNGNVVLDDNGAPIPCSFFITETLTDIEKASKFFAKTRKVKQAIVAEGWVSRCPDDNTNEFVLSGEACLK